MAEDAEILLKGPHTKFCLQPITLSSTDGEQSGLGMTKESLGLVALWTELKEQPQGSMY